MPDYFCDYSVKRHMEECAQEDTQKSMRFWYEQAVDEQKKELRDYRKGLKAQGPPMVVPVLLSVEPELHKVEALHS